MKRLLWPVLALVALLLLNLVFTPAFFSLRLQDGHLYGSLVDILRNGAPTLLIALGMTLVIATRGIDLSVGAVGGGYAVLPIAILISLVVLGAVALVTRRTALGMLIEAVGVNPEASRLAGVRSRTIIWTVYVFCALCAGIAGLMIASNVDAADANNAGLWSEMDAILAVVIGGTSLAGGRYSLTGTLIGALVIQTLTTTVYTIGVPPETTLVFKAAVVIVVCLLQAPRLTRALRRSTGPTAPAPAPIPPKPQEAGAR